jgi:hypothetical protein
MIQTIEIDVLLRLPNQAMDIKRCFFSQLMSTQIMHTAFARLASGK